jgi:hypothetical protein
VEGSVVQAGETATVAKAPGGTPLIQHGAQVKLFNASVSTDGANGAPKVAVNLASGQVSSTYYGAKTTATYDVGVTTAQTEGVNAGPVTLGVDLTEVPKTADGLANDTKLQKGLGELGYSCGSMGSTGACATTVEKKVEAAAHDAPKQAADAGKEVLKLWSAFSPINMATNLLMNKH